MAHDHYFTASTVADLARRVAALNASNGHARAAGQDTADTVPVFVPDGATLIRPTASSRKLLYRRPGKRSAAGR